MDNNERWQAFINRDSSKDGLFYTGVMTTGIYCKPSCRAKKPLRENIRFFETRSEAESVGFRPCKLCRPDVDEWVEPEEQLKEYLKVNTLNEPSLQFFCAALGISVSQINRLFKRRYQMTPKQYLDKLRVQIAGALLTDTNKRIIEIAMESGFKSLSGFNKHFKSHFRVTPSDYRKNPFILIDLPQEFKLSECLVYLGRSELESTHQVRGNAFIKLLEFKETLLLTCVTEAEGHQLRVELLSCFEKKSSERICRGSIRLLDRGTFDFIYTYYIDMFDLDRELEPFYALGEKDEIIGYLTNRFQGLRLCRMMDLFEGICWSIIGQQINLKFAYTLKKRLVEVYGEEAVYDGNSYYLFPKPEVLAAVSPETLRALQMTQRKSEYIIGIAKRFAETDFEKLLRVDPLKRRDNLLNVRGIGEWTADYILLKCFGESQAFPVADVGIHNALKSILKREVKPEIAEIMALAEQWSGWEGYVTFYLWRYLNGE